MKVSTEVSSVLKNEIGDTFVVTSARLDVEFADIEEWLLHCFGVAVFVKRLNLLLFWVKPTPAADFQKLMQTQQPILDARLRHLDRWTEVLGPILKPSWIHFRGIPLHA